MDAEVERLRTDVSNLSAKLDQASNLITRVATLQEQSEKAKVEERLEFREMVRVVGTITLQMTELKDIQAQLSAQKEDIRINKHDILDIKSSGLKLAELVKECIDKSTAAKIEETKQRTEIDELLKFRDRERERNDREGAQHKTLWANYEAAKEKETKAAGAEELKTKTWKIVTGTIAFTASIIGGVIYFFEWLNS